MKQIIQNYKTGRLNIDNVPSPNVSDNTILFDTKASLISAGTERTKIETASMNLIEKAISRLDLVKILVNNIKQEGIIFTLKKAFNKLDSAITLGYSAAGEIKEIGNNVEGFNVGDRVAAVGEVVAAHAEVNSCPSKYVVKLPDDVSFDEASFTGLGAIANNSVEISQVKSSEKIVVIGLGLLGQIVVQILKAKGCNVLGVEIDEDKIVLAKKFGMDCGANPLNDDVKSKVNNFTDNNGTDAVIITAASKNNLPLVLAGEISKNKGRVILVGAVDINIPRDEFYKKELIFMISRGFGADIFYPIEKKEYPFNYKPKSIKDNMIAFLSLLESKKIDVLSLITHKFSLDQAEEAYDLIRTNKEKYLGILFNYGTEINKSDKVASSDFKERGIKADLNIGFIGAGSFSQGYLLPTLKKSKRVKLLGVCTNTPINSKNVLRKFGFKYCTTDYNNILQDKDINCVFITTRHDMHARLVVEALKSGKKIFVEKPLALNYEQLDEVVKNYNADIPLMIGFNRRFAPLTLKAKDFIKDRVSPLIINYRVNAGFLPQSHWSQDPVSGGGRIVGEICHFVDMLQYMVGSSPESVYASAINCDDPLSDNIAITIKYEDGSIGTISYNSLGDSSFSRERMEIFTDSKVAVLDNYKELFLTTNGTTKKIKKYSRDMGHNNEMKFLVENFIKENKSLINFEDIKITTLVTFKILESLKTGNPVNV